MVDMKSGVVDPYFSFSLAAAGLFGGVVDCWYSLALSRSSGTFQTCEGMIQYTDSQTEREGMDRIAVIWASCTVSPGKECSLYLGCILYQSKEAWLTHENTETHIEHPGACAEMLPKDTTYSPQSNGSSARS